MRSGHSLTLYKKPPDLGFCPELYQHCACLFHVFVQVRGIQKVGYFLVALYLQVTL